MTSTQTHRRRAAPKPATSQPPASEAATTAGPATEPDTIDVDLGEKTTGETDYTGPDIKGAFTDEEWASDTPKRVFVEGHNGVLDAFAESLRQVSHPDAEVPYGKLIAALISGGWVLQLREAQAMPRNDGGTLISFTMLAGREASQLRHIDQISISVPPGQISPSLWARANAYPSIIMALFNRLPDVVPQQGAQQGTPSDPQPGPEQGDWEPLDLVEKRTRDGLPIYYDPFALNNAPDDIIDSLIASLEAEVPQVQSTEGLATLFSSNKNMFDYVRETRPTDYDRIVAEILNPRRDELFELEAPPAPAPRTTAGRAPTRR